MFPDFLNDFDHADETTKIFVRRNGTETAPKELRLPPNSKLADLFEKAGKVLDIEAPQLAFYSNGVECTDLDHLEDDEVIYISSGEPFRAAGSGNGAGGRVVGNFILHEKLGQGGFGSVMKGVHSETGEVAAVKFVPKSSFRQISDLQRVFQEIQALRNLHHPNVIRILDVADHPDNVCFIMEFAPGGELRAYVERQLLLEEEEARQFFKQIVRAIHYVHSKKIIHRDLKLENILLDAQNRCKIVDFGLSDYVSSKERTVTDAGTEAYLAPEVYNGCSGDADPYKIDVWGLGVILFALAHGRLPFSRPDVETCQKLVADGGPQYREEMSADYRRLVSAMLTPSPEKRASMDEISLDPWLTKNRFAEWGDGAGGPGGDDSGDDLGHGGAAGADAEAAFGEEALAVVAGFGGSEEEAIEFASESGAAAGAGAAAAAGAEAASSSARGSTLQPHPGGPAASRGATTGRASTIGSGGGRGVPPRGVSGRRTVGGGPVESAAAAVGRRRAPSQGPASPSPQRASMAEPRARRTERPFKSGS